MKKAPTNAFTLYLQGKYDKAQQRLERAMISGRFAQFTQRKKAQLVNRLSRYARQLGIGMKQSLVAAGIAAGLLLCNPAQAQTFTVQTGANNPLNGVDVGDYSIPTFVNIDNDGDKDVFIAESTGTIKYYKNTGTASIPNFMVQTGTANPFNGVNVGANSTLTFVDIDNDGDKDAFIGESGGAIKYYKNTGTASSPTLTVQTGAANPFNGVNVSNYAAPTFVDVDNDGDQDAFIGVQNGTIKYYKNTGTAASPTFTEQTGTANPFNGVDVGSLSTPTFVDVDNDGDKDAFIGEQGGTIKYYKNTGTASSPTFTVQTGTNNPFNGVDVGAYSTPSFEDIDNDGDQDAFIGESTGTVKYYKNTSAVLPVELLTFEGKYIPPSGGTRGATVGGNRLTWQTASEVNNKSFDIERSNSGSNFQTIGTIKAVGKAAGYNFTDANPLNGTTYYRLKINDTDGKFTYSNVLSLAANGKTKVKVYPSVTSGILSIESAESIEDRKSTRLNSSHVD